MFNPSRVGRLFCESTKISLLCAPVAKQDGNGQFELNWEYDDCLATADKHTFFKFMAKSVAEKHGEQHVDEFPVSIC